MNSVFVDFQTRSNEVEGYFRFVLRLAGADLSLRKTQSDEAAFSTHEHEELLKTLKATCYLLLYNLVESTMRNAIEAIFDELRLKSASFDDCREELRREILKNFKKRDMEKLLPKLLSLARDITHETFERSEMFAGNLDARTIRLTAKRFGFAEPASKKTWMLQTVKDVRNDLAHGVKSFADVGRNASPSDLEEARIQTVSILTETLQNISGYLQRQEYLTAVISAAPVLPSS
jgi:hypothetical protein